MPTIIHYNFCVFFLFFSSFFLFCSSFLFSFLPFYIRKIDPSLIFQAKRHLKKILRMTRRATNPKSCYSEIRTCRCPCPWATQESMRMSKFLEAQVVPLNRSAAHCPCRGNQRCGRTRSLSVSGLCYRVYHWESKKQNNFSLPVFSYASVLY